ncbi:MAG: 30S ribosomal protein S21 [Candidatus Raymondbacteria bacterium RifOxyC12_full_50_8]|uniref:Small ribosomal subunit protein bS21 n=1 Tax=Candidatus Raymondbacteria bacterium RIFOXYD12_FULL_49_13 TaxID=1817890 RepID=A0A1F7F0G6_UNCRA|nr:MAG: 30S ribosomal protein S21 [Candidatus Raymondbacteria bacterium RIFOXYA2_FULL_49_16]OGK00053.1 MAG: 30S ribosomal protein S21 [Candidatus Raymondbacteria bacterium RIFOXYD12_FULL_49_13]OGK01343.1 MAG: 30S ribosomal protein S21 [Candidatus Raymondbacteria bacterium RifOxyC12_full_50_8]OGK03670.1 MAG: 30S ribosomal protein S21 [Candidatus Raymondbacteria bacterium RifOxyB12_full_50_8]OGP45042.1 MAG: 30S ribosomal protein S21 [Candidatus Raymondbacteria bacterium RIFOXYB2_FULL_49_35]
MTTGVIIKPNETFEKAMRKFTKSCEKAGIVSEIKKNQYYEKPSERKKRKQNQAKRKLIKERLIELGIIKPRKRPTRY